MVRAAADHRAQFLGTRMLYLQPGTREHYLQLLQSEYPQLLAEYRWLFPGPYTPKPFQDNVRDVLAELKRLHALRDRPALPPRQVRQLSLVESGGSGSAC